MKKLKSTVQYVDKQGKFNPEALETFSSADDYQTVTTAKYQAEGLCEVRFPGVLNVNVARGAAGMLITDSRVMMAKGDVLTLAASTLLTINPL